MDLDLDESTVTILRGKGGKRRVAALNRRAVPYVEQWLRVRPESTFLFSTRSGRRFDDSYVRRAVRRQARKAGIIKRVSPHICRHTGAYHLANAGVDLRDPIPIRALVTRADRNLRKPPVGYENGRGDSGRTMVMLLWCVAICRCAVRVREQVVVTLG